MYTIVVYAIIACDCPLMVLNTEAELPFCMHISIRQLSGGGSEGNIVSTEPRSSYNVPSAMVCQARQDIYQPCMCMHHPGRNIIHFLVAVQMDLSSSSDKPGFVLDPSSHTVWSFPFQGRTMQQLTCKSHAAMKPTPDSWQL